MRRCSLASRNAHKLREFARMLGRCGIEVEPLPERRRTAARGRRHVRRERAGKARGRGARYGRRAIADDSGIEAAALGGAPGVRSARYAGEHASDGENLAKLIAEAPAGSALRYVCAIAYVEPSGEEFVVEGTLDGVMAAEPSGEGGFGYDPVFIPQAGDGKITVAELDDAGKDAISHRGRAARALAQRLGV